METAAKIARNLKSSCQENLLKSGIVSMFANLLSNSDDLNEYIELFESLDTSKDGLIEVKELIKGF